MTLPFPYSKVKTVREISEEEGDDSESDSGGEGKAIDGLIEEMAQTATERLRGKEGMSSGTSGTGQATYGGSHDNTEPDGKDDEVDKARRYIDDPSESPDDVEVQQGPQGGYYYETEESGDRPSGVDELGDPGHGLGDLGYVEPADFPVDADADKRLDLQDRDWSEAESATIPVGRITATQEGVRPDKVEYFLENPEETFDEPIQVAYDGENFYAFDGHHRLVAARLQGKEEIQTEVLRLDEDEKMAKGRVYVDSEEDVPEGQTVERGPKGGIYYVTGREEQDWPEEEGIDEARPGAAPEQDVSAWVDIENHADLEEEDWVLIYDESEFDKFPAQVLDTGATTTVETVDGEEITMDPYDMFSDLSLAARYEPDYEPEEHGEDADPVGEEITEEERREILTENMESLPEVPDEPSGDGESRDFSADEVSGGADKEETASALSQALSDGEMLGVPVDVEPGDDDLFADETTVPFYDSESNSEYGHVDVEMAPEDYSNIQAAIHEEYFDTSRLEHFGDVRVDDVEEMAEMMEDGETDIPKPYIVLDRDGNVTSTQEGRHRSLAALAADVGDMPVRLVVNHNKGGDSKMWKSDDTYWLWKTSKSFEEIDETFYKIHENIVQWDIDEKELDDDVDKLEKAPMMFQGDEKVPQFVKDFIREAFNKGAFWQGHFEGSPTARKLRDIFKESLTQPQGWSLKSIVENIRDEFPDVDIDQAEEIARQETAAITNTARHQAYKQSEEAGEEFKFYWSGPKDHRTTPVCEEMKEWSSPRHGGEARTIDEIQEKLMELAKEYEGGTPDRVDEFVPHYQCRHTFVRKTNL